MSPFKRKTFWNICSSKRFLLNPFSPIWLAFKAFFISPLLSTPDLHSYLGLSIPVFLHPFLSPHFFFFCLPGESPSHCWNISWAAEKTPVSSQLAYQHLLCLCYDLWSEFWLYRASDGDLLTFSSGFSFEASLLKVLWCEHERSVRKWMVRLSPLWVCGWVSGACVVDDLANGAGSLSIGYLAQLNNCTLHQSNICCVLKEFVYFTFYKVVQDWIVFLLALLDSND